MTTPIYDLHEIQYSTQGWDTIMAADMDILDAMIHTRIAGTGGETAAQYSAMYFKGSDGQYWKAQANGTKQPCMGLALESVTDGVAFRLQRVGPITNAGWSWGTVGGLVYLDPSTPGALTQVNPVTNREVIGIALSATSIFLMANISQNIGTYLDGRVQPITPGASVTIDWSLGETATLLLDRATTAITFSNPQRVMRLKLLSDATPGRAVTWTDTIHWRDSGTTPPAITALASTWDWITILWDGTVYSADIALNFS